MSGMSSSTVGGVNVDYEYYVLGRLAGVVDKSLGGTRRSSYEYDAVGNMAWLKYPNGVTNVYQYDAVNRLSNLAWNAGTVQRANFAYGTSPTGQRLSLLETVNGAGRSYGWKYDLQYRMTEEAVDLVSSSNGVLDYGFDAVGIFPAILLNDALTNNFPGGKCIISVQAFGYSYQAKVDNRIAATNGYARYSS